MKEKVEKIYASFKTGVMIWIIAYFLLYLISMRVGDFALYNENILKLLDVKNFVAQVCIAGGTYVTLEIVLLHFVDNMIKANEQEKDRVKKLLKSFVVAIFIVTLLCVALNLLKEKNIISKYILKLMIMVIVLKAIVFSITQIVKNDIYNKKLKEKNK